MKSIFKALFLLVVAFNFVCSDDFTCSDGLQLEAIDICNRERDCEDGEDEMHCNYCPDRDQAFATLLGYGVCRKPCYFDEQCRGSNKRCICDGFCGMTCINPGSICPHPPSIPGAISFQLLRWDRRTKSTVPVSNDMYFDKLGPDDLDLYTYRTEVSYNCGPGRELVGKNIWCNGRRLWSDNTPVCALQCEPRRTRTASRVGVTCSAACITNADCTDGRVCSCDSICGRSCVKRELDCGEAQPVPNTIIRYTNATYVSGLEKYAEYACAEGYAIAGGRSIKQCTDSGVWYGVDLICQRVECANPYESIRSTNGEVYGNGTFPPYYFGDTLYFGCPGDNHELFGASERTCLSDGQWSGELPVCDSNDAVNRCIHPGVPVSGRLIMLTGENFEVGSTVSFACDEGFALIGEPVMECLGDLGWSQDEAPYCQNPRYPQISGAIVDKIEAIESLAASEAPIKKKQLGRFIEASDSKGLEVYLLFDKSKSISRPELRNCILFAKELVGRLRKYKYDLFYEIATFSNEFHEVIDINEDHQYKDIEDKLGEILDNYIVNQGNTKTNQALEKIIEKMSFRKIKFENISRHLFVFTDGQSTDKSPVETAIQMKNNFDNLDIYTITSCTEDCLRVGSPAYNELHGIASDENNFIHISSYHDIFEKMGKITDIKRNYKKCGQMTGKILKKKRLGRVIAGTRSTEHAWPWQAIISEKRLETFRDTYKNLLGGGSLISNNWVLTAAHLFDNYEKTSGNWHEDFIVSFGMFKITKKDVETPTARRFLPHQIIIHPDYTESGNYTNDIALVRIGRELRISRKSPNNLEAMDLNLTKGVEFSAFIRPVCLPCSSSCSVTDAMKRDEAPSVEGSKEDICRNEGNWLIKPKNKKNLNYVTVTGFGRTKSENKHGSDYLLEGRTTIRTQERCKDGIDSINKETEGEEDYRALVMTDSFICTLAYNMSSCQGDSGGPLVQELTNPNTKKKCYIQVGIVSFGHGCGRMDDGRIFPSYYTSVFKFLPWIKQTTGLNITAY